MRLLWLTTGLLASGHHVPQRNFVACVHTCLLNVSGAFLLLAAVGIKAHGSASAYPTLATVAVAFFGVLLFLWLRDGMSLVCGRVNFSGDRIHVGVADADGPVDIEAADIDARVTPPKAWAVFRTQLGSEYYYDVSNGVIHYLSESGRDNQAIDSQRNRTYYYDSLEDLAEQMLRGGPVASYTTSTTAATAPVISRERKGDGKAASDRAARAFAALLEAEGGPRNKQHSDIVNPGNAPRHAPPSPTRRLKTHSAALEVDQVV